MPYTLNTYDTIDRWQDRDYLLAMSRLSDPLADEYFDRMVAANMGGKVIDPDDPESLKLFAKIFNLQQADADDMTTAFGELAPFFAQTKHFPPGTDLERCARGALVFEKTDAVSALILLAKSLPEGYAAPCLTEVLDLSQLLMRHPYKRLLATLQMLLQVSASFHPRNKTAQSDMRGQAAIGIAQKLRLWHSGVRDFADAKLPHFEEKYGKPVSILDMVATVMGFSYLVIEGWERLNVREVTQQEKEDYYYMWKVYALMMGCHPAGEPGNACYIPYDVADAKRFYEAYARERYEINPKGVMLAKASLDMLKAMIPTYLRAFGLGRLPRTYMSILMSESFCRGKLGLPSMRRDIVLQLLLTRLHMVLRPIEALRFGDGSRLATRLFHHMIKGQYSGDPVLMVPENITEVIKTFDERKRARMSTRATEAAS
jgi:hypothetical protein